MIALEQELREAAPRVTARGHLELVNWELPKTDLPAQPEAVRVTAPVNPVRRLPIDRVFEGGVLLLLASSVAAVCACLAHL